MKGRVLIAGFATRHVAQSAFRAGYEVCAIDHFSDRDLGWYAKRVIRFEDLSALEEKVTITAASTRFDFFVATSGAEMLCTPCPRRGTPPEVAGRFMDKLMTQEHFVSRGIPVPRLLEDGIFPAILKPRSGSGGWRNRAVGNTGEEAAWRAAFPDTPMLRQEIIPGDPASVSLLSDGTRAVPIATNLQILRGGGTAPWGFAGSMTPAQDHTLAAEMARHAREALYGAGCLGSVGVDFVLSERAWAIEVNPRFQATLDTVEMATGANLFALHVQACEGILPSGPLPVGRYAVRRILFADRDCTIREDCSRLAPAVADIPVVGTFVEEGGAIISVYGTGRSVEAAMESLAAGEKRVRNVLGL